PAPRPAASRARSRRAPHEPGRSRAAAAPSPAAKPVERREQPLDGAPAAARRELAKPAVRVFGARLGLSRSPLLGEERGAFVLELAPQLLCSPVGVPLRSHDARELARVDGS